MPEKGFGDNASQSLNFIEDRIKAKRRKERTYVTSLELLLTGTVQTPKSELTKQPQIALCIGLK